ncbi:MAG TPA: hypothetical protein DEX10_03175 [Betaproteobacteria bacterium]|nr:hypothetical protein [Betaproteobacteria bacterium]
MAPTSSAPQPSPTNRLPGALKSSDCSREAIFSSPSLLPLGPSSPSSPSSPSTSSTTTNI